MDTVVVGSIMGVVLTIIVFAGFLGYWLRKIMRHPDSHS